MVAPLTIADTADGHGVEHVANGGGPPSSPEPTQWLRRPRVFVVEDDALIALALMDRLSSFGCEPCGHAIRSDLALNVIPHVRPDVVFMDVHLGGEVDGIETARLLRDRVNAAVVFVTAFSDHALVERAVQAGAIGYVRKPYVDVDLRIALEIALARRSDLHEPEDLRETTTPSERPLPIEGDAIPIPPPAIRPATALVSAPATDDLPDCDVAGAMRDARSRFIAGFRRRCGRLDELITQAEERGLDEAVTIVMRHTAHRLASVAPSVGLTSVGDRARKLETLLNAPVAHIDVAHIKRLFTAVREAFSNELASIPLSWAGATGAALGAPILVVAHDTALSASIESELRARGYRATSVQTAGNALAHVRRQHPALVLLDVDLPGEPDGYGLCRQIKDDPNGASTPVLLITRRNSSADRMAAFALGADDLLAKPIEPVEMLLRVRWTLIQPEARTPSPRAGGGLMSSDAFIVAARRAMREGPASLALVRVNAAQAVDVAALFVDDLRRRDLVGRYSDTQLLLLLPKASAAAAQRRIAGLLRQARAAGAMDLAGGVVTTGYSPTPLVEPLLAQAEAALAMAEAQGRDVVVFGAGSSPQQTTVLIADDDPDVVQLVDARLKAAGYATLLAFDGEQALHFIETRGPSAVVLDLMMPKKTGFDVLAALRHLSGPRPRVVVVSARTGEDDVTRAFDLGADDYLTKPFSPQELMARLSRLVLSSSETVGAA